jgi:hypothetical protein
MKRILGVLLWIVPVMLPCSLRAGTLFTNPVIVVSPAMLKFGAADPHRTLTNTFLVENAGGGKLVGRVKVKPPFRVIDGRSYALRENEAQVVTIVYAPKSPETVTNTVEFTGGSGATATVVGSPLPSQVKRGGK